MSGHIASSSKVDWTTPANIVGIVRAFYDGAIAMDPCAGVVDLATFNIRLPVDGLEYPWIDRVYCNPPFGTTYVKDTDVLTPKQWRAAGLPPGYRRQTLSQWIDKADRFQGQSILLIPAAVDTKWWQGAIFQHAGGVCFIRGRVAFGGGAPGPAPMACALVYFGERERRFRDFFSPLGWCVR